MTSGNLNGMKSAHEDIRSVDVTGLPEEAVRAVEALATALRNQANGSSSNPSPEEWCKALREWAEGHLRLDDPADWSRNAIYAGRGE